MIEVSNEGHTIYLGGTTNSDAVLTAVGEAYGAPGVEHVASRLTITPR
jgi:osmotically-inducible protein OsmY